METSNRCRTYRWNKPIRVVLILCLMSAPAGLWAQSGGTNASSYFFPRFFSGSRSDSGLAIFNPTNYEAVASVTLIDERGIEGAPVAVKVPALGRATVTAAALSGSAGTNTSVRVTSETPGIYATYSTFDSRGTAMDGTGAAQSSMQLIFPVAPGVSARSMEIVLRNATAKNTGVQLTLWDFKGTALGSVVVPLPASAGYRAAVGSMLPSGTDYTSASHITATAKPWSLFSEAQPFYGTSVFSSAPPLSSESDVVALNGMALTEALTTGVIPYFRTGGGYFSYISIANAETASVNVTLNAIRNNGTSVGSRVVAVSANGGLRQSIESLFPALASGEQQGWILVQSTGRIAAHLLYGRREGGSLAALPLQKTPQYRVVFPQVAMDESYSTDVSIVSPGPNPGDADVFVVDPSGKTLAVTRIPLTPGIRAFFSLDQMFPELPELPGGLISIVASQPVTASVSVWSNSGSTVIGFPQAATLSRYAPTPLTQFSVKGRVILNGEAVDGFRVILSGPVGNVAITAADGTYKFDALPPGRYSMKVDQFGFEFSPALVNFEITSFNIYQEFTGITPPGEVIMLPASIPVGGKDVVARVYGTGFDGTSQAFVETVRLKTTYVSSNRLDVLIPAYLTEKASTFQVVIATGGSGSNLRTTKPYPVVVFLDKPVLSSVSTVGDIMEGAQVAVLEITGSGFLPGLKVKVNGLSDDIDVNLVSDSEVVARVPARYLEIGGIYPVTVENPFPSLNAESNIQLMTVYFPSPAVTAIEPVFVHVQLEDSTTPELHVSGFQFRRGAIVMFESDKVKKSPLPTSYCSRTPACVTEELTAKIPAEYLRYSGFAKITVQNPVPSLAASEIRVLRIDGLQPTITSVLPGSVTVMPVPPSLQCNEGDPDCQKTFRMVMPILVDGTNIGPQTEKHIGRTCGTPNSVFSSGGVHVIGPTQLYVDWDVPAGNDALGEWCIQLKNPEPGGGISEIEYFVIELDNFVENPFLVSMSPASVAAGGSSFTLTVNGVNFKEGSRVYFSTTQLTTTFVSGTQLQAQVPAYLVRTAGRRPIKVINPDTGGASNRLFIEVN